MAQGGTRPKDTYIQLHQHPLVVVLDSFGEEIDKNLSVAQSLHDSHGIEQSPKD